MKLNTMLGLGLLLASTSVYAEKTATVIYLPICDNSYQYNIVDSAFLPNPDGSPSAQCMNLSSGVIQAPTTSGTLVSYESELAARVTALERKLTQLRTQLGLPQPE